MAIVKHPHEASAVTLESKHQRYDRLRRLFGIRRLGDLFPPGSTPNGAAHDPAYCSGDVLRDLCQIGEYLKNKGVGRTDRLERVRKEFRAGQIVQHREIRELLSRVKKNEFEERLKNSMKKEPGLDGEEDEDAKRMITTPALDESILEHGSPACAFTTKESCINTFMSDAHAASQRMEGSQDVEEVKYADTPGFASAEQIRASFSNRSRRRRRDNASSPIKCGRDKSVVEIKEEPVSATSTNSLELGRENQGIFSSAIATLKQDRFSIKNPLMPHSARQIAQDSNIAPAKVAGGMVGKVDGDGESVRMGEIVDLIHRLDGMIGDAREKLRGEDVYGADALLAATKKLIGVSLGGRAGKEEAGCAVKEGAGFAFGEMGKYVSEESARYRDSSEDGV